MGNELYDVAWTEVTRRYVGEAPVECVVFHKRDGTAVTVRLDPAQMGALRNRLTGRLGELAGEQGRRWPGGVLDITGTADERADYEP